MMHAALDAVVPDAVATSVSPKIVAAEPTLWHPRAWPAVSVV